MWNDQEDDEGEPDNTDALKYQLENTTAYPYGKGIIKTVGEDKDYQENWNQINNSITLKITCYSRKLNTMFLGRKDG